MAKAVVKGAPAKKGAAGKKQVSSDDELSALALANKEMEDEERAKTGSQNSFLTLVKQNGRTIDKNSPSYIPGVKPLDWVIISKKLKLGKKLDATILGMCKVYAETKPGETDKEMAATVGFWMPDDAANFEQIPGTIGERMLPNGNTLVPTHWVFVYLHDNPEIADALISFRGKGNSIYTQLEKLVKAESAVCTELRFDITNQDIYNDKFKKTDYYPKFEITGRNFKLTEDGKVVKTKDSRVDAGGIKELLSRSQKVLSDYKQMKLVAKKNVQAIAGPEPRKALPAGKGADYQDDEGDTAVNF
jgi:hypothetical protein